MTDRIAFSLDFSDCSNGYIGYHIGTAYKWMRCYELKPVIDPTGRGWVLEFKASHRPRRLHTYAEMKDAARALAIDWQGYFTECGGVSYMELFAWQQLFNDLGRRYGLLREFHENGIC